MGKYKIKAVDIKDPYAGSIDEFLIEKQSKSAQDIAEDNLEEETGTEIPDQESDAPQEQLEDKKDEILEERAEDNLDELEEQKEGIEEQKEAVEEQQEKLEDKLEDTEKEKEDEQEKEKKIESKLKKLGDEIARRGFVRLASVFYKTASSVKKPIEEYAESLLNSGEYAALIDEMHLLDSFSADKMLKFTKKKAQEEGIELTGESTFHYEDFFREIYKVAEKGLS